MEVQVGQLAKEMVNRLIGTLPNIIENHLIEHAKSVQVVEDKKEEGLPFKAMEEEKKDVSAPPPYKQNIPYPRRLYLAKVREQVSQFLGDFEKLYVNSPLVEESKNTSSYVTCLQEVASRKRKLKEKGGHLEIGQVLPPKLMTRKFHHTCTIVNFSFNNILCDLGVSIIVMSFSMFRSLGMEVVKPTACW